MLLKKLVLMKWRQNDVNELRRVIRNFNNKLARVKQKDTEGKVKIYPERMRYKEVRDKILTREDYNRIIAEIKLFCARGMEDIYKNKHKVEAMRWELEVEKIRIKYINKERARELRKINKIDITIGGRKVETASITITKRELSPKKFNFENMYSRHEFEAFRKTTEKQAASDYWFNIQNKYVDNYIKALVNVFSPSQAKELIKLINRIPLENMIELYHKEMLGNIDYIYEPQEQGIKYEYLVEMFREHIKLIEDDKKEENK